jgi:hypothetical protein
MQWRDYDEYIGLTVRNIPLCVFSSIYRVRRFAIPDLTFASDRNGAQS